ncbi:MAG: penicillin acylase family protein [Acidilobus sp.]
MRKVDYASLGAAIVILALIAFASSTPPLSVLLSAANPGGSVYGYSLNAVVRSETLRLSGLKAPVSVVVDKYGVYHIYASNLHDLFLALGWIEAQDRLWQMDILRRASAGNLSPILGPSYLKADLFQIRIGNLITAEMDWNETLALARSNSMANLTVIALEAFSQGVNDYIAFAEAHHELPFMFTLLHYRPQNWTPVDSFLVQQYMVEGLEFSDDPLVLSLLYYKMGNLTNYLVPPFPPIPQVYYAGYQGPPNETVAREAMNIWPINSTVAQLAYQVVREWDPPFITHWPPEHSNEWVVAGSRTATGHPILVGGPVLSFTLPMIWIQAQLVAPGFDVYGVIIPGEPAVVIGFNDHIAWTLTDVEAISWGTFFLVQSVNATDYYFNGSWHPIVHYRVGKVIVNWTNWGPIMAEGQGLAIAMYWLGNVYSNDLGALLEIATARNWTQFLEALKNWKAPYQNFAYADSENIGDVSAGAYPIFAVRDGSLPYSPDAIMPGDGEEYVSGWIPFNMVPQSYNPATGFIVSSNQRQVGPAYPYWFGDSMTPSPGTRAWVVYDYLERHTNVTVKDMMELQWNETDLAAAWTTPRIIQALEGSPNPYAREALQALQGWNYTMAPGSKAATAWFYIYSEIYFNVIYGLFNRTGLWPEFIDFRPGPAGGSWPNTSGIPSFDEDIIHMLVTGDGWPLYNGSVDQLIVNSTIEAMKLLYGYFPDGNFTWANFYGFYWPSLTGASALGYGPSPIGGDYFTLNDASGGGGGPLPASPATGGQSFTFIANLANLSDSYGVYPGGQSENPASPLYDSYIPVWTSMSYLPLLFMPNTTSFQPGEVMAFLTMEPG